MPESDDAPPDDAPKPQMPLTAARQGTVKWFNPAKGFGFVTPNDGGKDVFVHITAVQRAGLRGLAPGQAVEFQVAEGAGDLEAESIRPTEPWPLPGKPPPKP